MSYHDHKKLDVWKKSMDLVTVVYQITNSFPKEEKFGLTSQIRRASVSIPTNIAEGCGRNSDAQLINFLNISRGSASELETLFLISNRLNFLSNENLDHLVKQIKTIEKQLFSLMRKLKHS